MRHILKPGFKTALIPVFVIYLILSYGFSRNYLRDLFVKTDPGTQTDFSSFTPALSRDGANLQLFRDYNDPEELNFLFPDSNENKLIPAVPDSNAKANLSVGDSTKMSAADSLKALLNQDSLRRVDSLSKDSTARIEQFKAKLTDSYAIPFRSSRPSSLFAYPSASMKTRTVQLDSTGNYVLITEKINNEEIRPALKIPLVEYIKMKLNSASQDIWEQLAYKYELKSDKKDFGQLITDITNIDIPLPSTSFLSIFGPPKINLKIAGAVDIHGAWRNETTTGITTSALGNTRNEPDFKQQVQINLSGTIGDKLTLSADWNTERTFQYENQLKLKYTGYEDEIVQSVEAGNVSLQTSPLVGGSEALFGVKALFKMGPFTLTALASQKKGEVQEVSVSSGAKSQQFEIHAYDYSPNHFFIHEMYYDPKINSFNKYYGNPVPIPVDSIRVKDIEVWKTVTGLVNPNERKGNAYITLPRRKKGELLNSLRSDTAQSIPGIQEINRRFLLLTPGVDYTVNKETGFINFITQVQDQDAIAVAFNTEGRTSSPDDDVYFGEFLNDVASDSTARIVLQLVKPPNLQPQFKKAWKLQLRNIYPIGGRDIKQEGFNLDIKYVLEGQEPVSEFNGVKLLSAFGLDKTDKSGTSPTPDGAFDFLRDRTIMPSTGEVIFPVLEPFGNNLPADLQGQGLEYRAIYDTTVTFAKQDRAKDKFILSGDYSASVTSVYSIGFNVVENSVKVLLNGSQLSEGTDYTVDYNIGQVIIRKPDALSPGQDLKITYEQNDLFALASKTLLGFRGLYQFNKNTSLGFTFLNLNQQTLSDKVRIGEEPLNNSIMGTDFQTTVELPFVTKALDKIISTSAPSSFNVKAEYAYINPDPNTKKSNIESDGGNSIAYIDDFEGAKRTIPLGTGYGQWKDISVPSNLPFISGMSLRDQVNYKANTYWFNRTPSDVTIKAIYGDRKQNNSPDAQLVPALDFVYTPTKKGYYNWYPNLSDPAKNWGGMMKGLSSTASNLVEENIEFIEFWVKIEEAPPDLQLHVDLGQISEDVIPNGSFDTEDKNGNSLVDEGEDVGLDGLPDTEEPGYDAAANPDPSGDNYSYQYGSNDYSHIDGTQGNAVSIDLGRIPDSEDLNGNLTLDNVNSFFRYDIPLDTNATSNPFMQKGPGNAGWYLVRIPLKDYDKNKIVGNPSFSVIESIRFWVSGAQTPVHLRFAELNLVGNQWQKVIAPPRITAEDSTLTVSTVNLEDNPEYYSPPGLPRERDRSKPDYEVYKNEQSLDLIIKNLKDGDSREVVRYLPRPLDVFNYKQMKFSIHGDLNETSGSVSHFVDSTDYASEVYLRFGSDSLNFYEYRQPVKADWNEVSLMFAELTAIKQRRNLDSTAANRVYLVEIPDQPGHYYGVRGNPTLTKVSFFTVGILNPVNRGTPGEDASGSIWVNELRVLQADNTPGWAYSASTSFKFADLLNVNFNISQTNPYFHKLADRFGNRIDSRNWSLQADLDVMKLIPLNLPGSNLKLSYAHTESGQNPLFKPGTDVKVSEAEAELRRALEASGTPADQIESIVSSMRAETETMNVSETWTVSNFNIKIPTELWYIRDIFNNLNLGFNYNKTFSRAPTVAGANGWLWNATANYSVNLSRDLFFKPVDIPLIGSVLDIFTDYKDLRINFLPQSITASMSANRRYSFSLSRGLTTVKPNIQRDFTATRGAGFTWQMTEGGLINLAMNYNFDVQSTLAYLLVDNDVERTESQIWKDILGGQLFGKDFNYRQSFDLRTNPKLPSIFNLNRYITINASYNSTYNWQNNLTQGDLGRGAGYNNRVSAGLTVRLKSIFAPLFVEEAPKPVTPSQPQTGGRAGGRRSVRGGGVVPRGVPQDNVPQKDSVAVADTTRILTDDILEEEDTGPGILGTSLEYLKLGAKWLLFDYDQIAINFSQTSSYMAGALKGDGTGFNNFWGVKQNYSKGPNRLFALGLSNDPGPRAPNGYFTDNYSHKNQLDLKTSRPLWEGAQLDITWNVSWGINKSTPMQTDSLGNISITGPTSTGSLDRSFLSMPNVFSFLGGGITKVHELYDPASANPASNLSDAFSKGFETIGILSKVPFLVKVMKYIPRPNWTFNWSGLEKISFLNFFNRVTIQHTYTSSYSEGWKINTDGLQEVQSQRVDYAFAPLLGINFAVNKLFDGSLQANLRYSTKNSYSLGASTRNITEAFSRDISVTASYSKSGFELPLFGLSLKNDIEVSISYTSQKNSSVIFEMDNFSEAGKPQDGTTRTTIEPKIKYVMSSRVTLSVFYRRTTVEPQGASRIPPTTTNEAGVDVHISIQ